MPVVIGAAGVFVCNGYVIIFYLLPVLTAFWFYAYIKRQRPRPHGLLLTVSCVLLPLHYRAAFRKYAAHRGEGDSAQLHKPTFSNNSCIGIAVSVGVSHRARLADNPTGAKGKLR